MSFSQKTYIPLSQALRKYGVSKKVLLQRIKSGKLATAKLPDGEVLVAEHEIGYPCNQVWSGTPTFYET